MLTGGRGGVHKNLTFADRGEGGSKMAKKNADVINERPLIKTFIIEQILVIHENFEQTLHQNQM